MRDGNIHEIIRQDSLEHMKTERLSRETVAKGAIITYCHDRIKTPAGHECVYDFLEHPGAAAALPVLDDGRIVMVRQYRNALDRFTLEIPAGGLNGRNEDTKDAALRELKEETGFEAGKCAYLLTVDPTVAYGNEKIDIYVAADLKKSERALDEDEYINVEAWSVEDLAELILAGKIRDAKTCAAVMTWDHIVKSGKIPL